MSDLISVIVPVYKTEQYLERCVKSIMSQTYQALEIILVDDGSPDQSGAMCDRLAESDKRIRVIHKKNGGLSSARNAGIEDANGAYICFVDSDDYILKDHVQTLYDLICQYNAELAKINYAEVNSDSYQEKNENIQTAFYTADQVEEAFFDLHVDSACVFMYKRELIEDTRFPEGKTSEDIPFNFRIFQKAKSLAYSSVKKYCYYYNPQSISNGSLNANMLNYLWFRKEIYDHCREGKNETLIRKAESQYARAAMGLMSRMALYGIAEGMDEKENKALFRSHFIQHKKAFFFDKSIAMSRKLLAIGSFYFYPCVTLLRGFMK